MQIIATVCILMALAAQQLVYGDQSWIILGPNLVLWVGGGVSNI